MSTVQSQQSSDEFENAKHQIRGLIAEIGQIAKSDLQPEEFYAAFLQRVVQALAAVGGAVWILGEGRRPQLSYQINLSPTLLDPDSDDATRHARLLDMVVASNQPQLVPPLSGNEQGGNPTRNLLVIAPLGHDKAVEGIVEIFQRPNAQPNTQRGYLKFVLQMCELASEWFKNRKLSTLSDRHSLWAQADQFSRLVHDSLDVRETAYTIVNEGRKLIGCDRVSLCITRGGKCKVEAISGQDTMDTRSNVVHHLSTLAQRVIASGETLWYHGSTEDMPPQIEKAIEAYVDESYTKSMVILPLRKPRPGDDHLLHPDNEELAPREIFGAMIIEQLETDLPRELLEPRIDLVYEHSARAMSNTIDHHSLFLMPVWKQLGKSKVVVQGRNLPKTVVISSIALIVLLFMALYPVNLNLRSEGALQPIEKQDVFAPLPGGQVDKVLKDDGDIVEKGEPLLTLVNEELLAQIAEVNGKLSEALQRQQSVTHELLNDKSLTAAERSQLQMQQSSLKPEILSLRKQLEIKRNQEEKLTVRSPRDGRVVTWKAQENLLLRPVQPGDLLMSVADLNSDWRLELYVPERRAGKLRRAFNEAQERKARGETGEGTEVEVSYILMTDPHRRHEGVVTEIENSTFVHDEEGPCVRVKVALKEDDQPKNPRPNATLTANVDAGDSSLGYWLFHEAWEYAQRELLFW